MRFWRKSVLGLIAYAPNLRKFHPRLRVHLGREKRNCVGFRAPPIVHGGGAAVARAKGPLRMRLPQ